MRNFMSEMRRIIVNRPGFEAAPALPTIADQLRPKPASIESTPASKPERDKTIRFDVKKKEELYDQVRALHKTKKAPDIAAILNAQGFTNSTGSAIVAQHVNNYIADMRKHGTLDAHKKLKPEKFQTAPVHPPATQAEIPKKLTTLPDAVSWILLDTALTDTQKVAMFKAWQAL